MLKSLSFMALVGHVSCAGGAIDYTKIGEDWPTDSSISNNECAGEF